MCHHPWWWQHHSLEGFSLCGSTFVFPVEREENSLFHLQQNSLVRCCTCRHHFLAYRSADLNTPGGDRTTFVFNLRKWFGVSASVEPGDDMLSAVYGRLLTMASASHMKVCKASSFTCCPFFSSKAESTLLAVQILRSQWSLTRCHCTSGALGHVCIWSDKVRWCMSRLSLHFPCREVAVLFSLLAEMEWWGLVGIIWSSLPTEYHA